MNDPYDEYLLGMYLREKRSNAAKKAAATRKHNREREKLPAPTRVPLTFRRLAPKLLAGVSHNALVTGSINVRHGI